MYKKVEINKHIKQSTEGNYSIDISTDNKICYSSSKLCTIYNKEDFLSQNKLPPQSENTILLGDTIISSKFSPNSERLIISDYEYYLTIYDVNNLSNPYHQFTPGILKSFKFAISPNNSLLCTGSNNIILFDIDKKVKIKEFDNHNKFLYSSCFISNDKIAAGNNNGSVTFFNINEDKYIYKMENHCLPVRSLSYSSKDNLLFSASDDLHINVTDMNKYKERPPLVGHQDKITNLYFNDYNGLLYSSSFDGSIKVWDYRKNPANICTLFESKGNIIWDFGVENKGEFIVYTGEEFLGAYQI